MTEGLFILTTMFVAYVVYTIVGDEKANANANAPAAKPETKPETQATAAEQAKPQVAVANEKPAAAKPAAKTTAPKQAVAKPAAKVAPKAAEPKVAAKPAAKAEKPKPAAKPSAPKPAKTAVSKKAAAPTPAKKSAGLKNPSTGEVVTTYTNYRFTKRWIKDALVSEGFLEKVYKNNELNVGVEAAIKEALAKLEAMDKYKA